MQSWLSPSPVVSTSPEHWPLGFAANPMADSSTATDIRCNPRSVPQVLLVQIEDEDDNLTGMSGAIGRLETNDERQESKIRTWEDFILTLQQSV